MLFVLVATLFFLILVFGCMPGNAGPPSLPSPAPTKDEKKEEDKTSAFTNAQEDEEAAAKQIRFNKQCWLIDSFEDFLPLFDEKRFEHFSTITDDPAEVGSQLVANKRVNPLFQIKPHQMALLQPRIRLFIVRRSGPNTTEDIPLKFASGFSEGSVGSSEEYADLFKSTNLLGAGAGIKSFSYELAGVNPAEADKLIEATLVLYFQSVGDLFAVRGKSSNGEDVRFADLINYGPAKGKRSPAQQRTIDPEDFRIKAVVGWSEPEIAQAQRSGLISEELSAALAQSKTTLFLQLVDHTLSFRQEGNVELEIKYMAALQQTIESSKMDLLWSPTDTIINTLQQAASSSGLKYAAARKQRIEKAIEDLDKFIKTNNVAGRRLKDDELQRIEQLLQESLSGDGTNPYTTEYDTKSFTRLYKEGYELGGRTHRAAGGKGTSYAAARGLRDGFTSLRDRSQRADKDIEDAQGRANDAAAELEKVKAIRRDFLYRRIIDTMVFDDRIYVIDVGKDEIGAFQNSQIGGASIAIETREAVQTAAGKTKLNRAKPRKASADQKKDDLGQVVKASDGRKVSELVSESQAKTIQAATDSEKDTVPIFFFFFGDLIDIAIKTLKQPQKIGESNTFKNQRAIDALEKFSILMGPVSFRNSKTGEVKIINVSQIPISFDLFQQWWLEKVIKPQRVAYELRDFLKDAMRELVAPGLGQGCYNGYRQSGKMSMIPLTIPKTAGGGQRIPKFGARCRLADIKNRRAAPVQPERRSTQVRNLEDYLYFFIADEYVKTRKVNAEADTSNGIYHLRIGEDRGIVKSIDFHQTDIQFLKEARITNDADVKDGFLRKKYDAKIKTIGNTLFAPGQYVYVHPTVPGASGDALIRQQLQKIGLGGYYLVTKVFHIISQDYYQAEIEAKWEAFGVAENDKITKITQKRVVGQHGPCQGKDPNTPGTLDLGTGTTELAEAKEDVRRAQAIKDGLVDTAIGLALPVVGAVNTVRGVIDAAEGEE